MIYRQDKINSTPNHLHLLTYALYIRRTRLHNDTRRRSSAVTGHPRGVTTSSRYNSFNSANVTNVLSYLSKSMYNPQDTVKNNLIKGTGHYVPYDLDETQTMRGDPGYVHTDSLPNSCVLRLPEHQYGVK